MKYNKSYRQRCNSHSDVRYIEISNHLSENIQSSVKNDLPFRKNRSYSSLPSPKKKFNQENSELRDFDSSHNLVNGFRVSHYNKTGDRYEGKYKNGKRNGFGVYLFHSGDKYSGQWKDGTMHGKGSWIWSNGDSYEGDFERGQMTGNGVLHSHKCTIHGSFVNGEVHGYAVKEYACGDIYRGNFVCNRRNGYGEYLWVDGKKYNGSWVNDDMEGNGQLLYSRKSLNRSLLPDANQSYEGEFMKSLRHGYGSDNGYFPGMKFEGYWRIGLPHGWGKLVSHITGVIYVGEFFNGFRQGYGQLCKSYISESIHYRIISEEPNSILSEFYQAAEEDQILNRNEDLQNVQDVDSLNDILDLADEPFIIENIIESEICQIRYIGTFYNDIAEGLGIIKTRCKKNIEVRSSSGQLIIK